MNPTPPSTSEKQTGRVEAFSDGVFSIAMTLLVLELKVPHTQPVEGARGLWRELAHEWPSYLSFITSFATVLIMWVNHHGIFRLIHRVSPGLLYANGFLLLLVTAVPFPTALVGTYLKSEAASAACAVYGGLFVFISIGYSLVLLAGLRGDCGLNEDSKVELRRRLRDCIIIGTPLYSSATLVARFSPGLSLTICTGLWLFWAIRHQSRWAFDE